MKTFICLLGLAAVCTAGVIESKGSEEHGSSAWQPSNAPTFDYSNYGNGHSSAGQGQGPQALTQHEAGSFGHEGGQGLQFNHGGQGYDLSGQGQAKSFDIGHGSIPSFGGSGHDFGGDSYLQAAHDFGNHGTGQGDFGGHDGGYSHGFAQGYESGHGGEGHGDGSSGHGDAAGGYHGGSGQTQAIILHDGGNEYGHGGQDAVHDLGVQGLSHDFGGHGFQGGLGHAEPFSVGEHTDEEHPVEVPNYKHVTVPVHKPIHVSVPKPILIGIPQPYPVKVPVNKPVAVPVETDISIPIEKVVPYPVVKHVPYPVEKHVPFKVEKTVHVHVPQPYPVKVPIYKTIHHYKNH